ncbi:aspartate aminotransferase family protein [Candidatus Neomarinimicrobiota bacterium]
MSLATPEISSMAEIMALEDAFDSGAYSRRSVALVRGKGALLWDPAGNRYIDCVSGIGVAGIGHCHPVLTAAIQEQLERLVVCSGAFYNDQRALFLRDLTAITPVDLNRAFLCNSGAEAVEGAIKAARFFTGRTKIVAHRRAFHGRTMGALSLTWKPKYRDPFRPLLAGFTHVPLNDIDALEAEVTDDTAAVVLEIIQGEGGIWPADPDYLHAVRRLCDERGSLLVVDEVQTGMGRTGSWFACDQSGLIPDIICLGKSLAGGIPIGAVVWRDSLGTLRSGIHGSTFGGNPLACVAARTVIRIMADEDLPGRAARLGEQFIRELRGLNAPGIREVRGRGLMIGVDLRYRAGPVIKALMDKGVLANSASSTVVRLLPPLVITEDELAVVGRTIAEVLGEHETVSGD